MLKTVQQVFSSHIDLTLTQACQRKEQKYGNNK